MADLVEALDAHVTPRAVGDEQRPDRFHVAIGGLRHARRAARQGGAGGLHGVEAVGLAVPATGLTIGAIDLHHRHPHTAQEAGHAGPVGAGALHPDPPQRAERAQPGVQVGEPDRGRRERPDAEQTAVGVQRGGDVHVQMGVDSAGDRARLYDGHGHPFSVQVVKGWHARPGKETVTIGLRPTDPIDHPPERGVPISAHRPADTHRLDARTSQTGPQEPLTVATIGTAMVDHHQWTPPSSLGIRPSFVTSRPRSSAATNSERLLELSLLTPTR